MKNVEIDNANKEVTLKLNMKMYNYDAILQASKEFSENFWIIIEGDINDKLVVNLKPKPEFIKDVNLNELGYEFCNFTLGLMQNMVEN